ncbi:MAG: bifunctional pyr operon transcriptional regulator/uracil phosphoribosyltransferase PyrR [Bifidobacteriaceae bacterium]|nr:bifunctional pyr operon transcriptional regulator/uracil phosphoribosyltransferase PyrR [Bifidobacteriaceae bacterium]
MTSPPPGTAGTTVLTSEDMHRALRRIAHEILEQCHGAEDLVLLGIPTRGATLAKRLAEILGEIEPAFNPEQRCGQLDVTLYRDDLRRLAPRTLGSTALPKAGIDDATVILVDDVLYSGRTVRAALDALGDYGRPRTVRLAVLVDRGHRELPIRADHVGKNLPTSRTERVTVRLQEVDGMDDVAIAPAEGSRQ